MEDPTKPEEEIKTETKPEESAPVVETPKEEVKEEIKPAEATVLSETSNQIQIELEELKRTNTELIQKIASQEAEKSYEILLRKGKVLPTMKETFLALSQQGSNVINLSDGSKQTIGQLLINLFDSLPTLVNLEEKGITVEDGDSKNTKKEALVGALRDSFVKRNPMATTEKINEYMNSSPVQTEINVELAKQK